MWCSLHRISTTRAPRRSHAPLQHEHIKILGRFPFTLPHELAAGQRRQLHNLGETA